MQLTTADADIMYAVWNLMMTHQIDLLMFLIGLVGYFVLFKNRAQWKKAIDVSQPGAKIDDSSHEESIEFLLSVQIAAGNLSEVKHLMEDIQAKEMKVVLSEEVLNSMLSDSLFVIGGDMINVALDLAKSQTELSHSTYALLIKGLLYSGEQEVLPAIITEAIEQLPSSSISMELINSILDFCRDSSDHLWLADQLLKRLQPAEWNILSEFIDFYLEMCEFENACDIYELNFALFFDAELDRDTESGRVVAALRCGRCSLAEHLCGTSPQDFTRSVATIQRWWKHQMEDLQARRRERHVGDVMARLSDVFQERFPFHRFEEGSDDESTVFLGDDDDLASLSDLESNGGESDWSAC